MFSIKNKPRLDEMASTIIAMTDYARMVDIFSHPGMAQYVITGPQYERVSALRRIGYCVQVRKGSGLHGSNLVFLRHPDGELVAHENQSFFTLTDEQLLLARHLFQVSPENEPFAQGYRCADGIREVGFLIRNSASCPTQEATPRNRGFGGLTWRPNYSAAMLH